MKKQIKWGENKATWNWADFLFGLFIGFIIGSLIFT